MTHYGNIKSSDARKTQCRENTWTIKRAEQKVLYKKNKILCSERGKQEFKKECRDISVMLCSLQPLSDLLNRRLHQPGVTMKLPLSQDGKRLALKALKLQIDSQNIAGF